MEHGRVRSGGHQAPRAIGLGDGERVLLVPRWHFEVPNGPPVDVLELLPLTAAQWAELSPLSLAARGAWAAALADPPAQWDKILGG